MQVEKLKLKKIRIGSLPAIDQIFKDLDLNKLLVKRLGSERMAGAIEVLIKSLLLEPAALYRIPAWAKQFEPSKMGNISLNDDLIGRSLDRLFESDRATLQTEVTTKAIQSHQIDLSRIHNDSTSIKFYGAYKNQSKNSVQLKRGYSKDHRPDLKQLLYNLSVSADGCIPIHFKVHDGNTTDDTSHIENWLHLRNIIGFSSFLYVADSKLCTAENLRRINREHGKFVTIVPKTNREVDEFYKRCYESSVEWELLTRRPSTRKKGCYDVFYLAQEFYQLNEGFRIFWYRSSEKKKRDEQSRNERIETALDKLAQIKDEKRRGPKTEKALKTAADKIIQKYKVGEWINVSVNSKDVDEYKKTTKGAPSANATYLKVTKKVPYLITATDKNAIARSKAVDGLFPLTTNTKLSAIEVLEAYKYQPNIEKQFSFIKSDIELAPVFLKKTSRIEAIMFCCYLSCLVAALIQRKIRIKMKKLGLEKIATLPEERSTTTPTWEQIQRLFSQHCKYKLQEKGVDIRTFSEEISDVQETVIELLDLKKSDFM